MKPGMEIYYNFKIIIVLMYFARVVATKGCKHAVMASGLNNEAVRTLT